MPDLGGLIVGLFSILVLYLLWVHCDELGNGNIGSSDDNRS